MKSRSLCHFVSIAVGLAVLPFGLAATPAPSSTASPESSVAALQSSGLQRVGWEEAKKHKLRHAFWILDQADRDYHGHRFAAQEEIRKAGKIIGMDLKGEGYSGEKKPWSDDLLREARRDLKDIVEDTGGKEHEHIRTAIKEIDRALEVR
jgi:hypothetical protein